MRDTRLVEPSPNARLAAYIGLIAAVSFAMLTVLVIANRTAVIDHELILSLRAEASPLLTTILLAVTFTSGKLAIPAAIVFAVALHRRSGARATIYYAVACVAGQLIDALLKYDVARVRPHGISPRLTAAGGFSYPTADAMLAVLIFGLGTVMLAWTIRSARVRAAALSLAAVFIVAASVARVYLGAHWPSDVLGGLLAGIACAAFFVSSLRRPPAAPTVLSVSEV
jgi:undecaprenyl-diphosphatase